MGEARRRKQLLGNEYGKSSNQEIKRTELSRPPIPNLEQMKLKLSSIELRDWLIAEWSRLNCFAILVTPEDACLMASTLLEMLCDNLKQDLEHDSSVNYDLSPWIEISVGINAYNWTVWAVITDRSIGFRYATSDWDEFRLA